MNRVLYIITILFLVVIALSCRLKRETKKEIKEVVKNEEGVDIIFEKMKEAQFNFRTISLKFSATATDSKDKGTSFSGNLRIVKDREIWLSISPALGIEAFRVYITNDSVKMINRIKKTYFRGDYQLINDLLNTPFDFDMLQAFLTGNDFNYYENNVFKVGEDDLFYRISTIGRKKLKNYVENQSDIDKVLVQDMWINPETYKIVRQQIKEIKKENNKLTIDYLFFEKIGNALFPNSYTVKVDAENKLIIDVAYEKIKVDEEVTIPFTIPSSYKPMKEGEE
ncbi:MAG: hypothetical protein C0592_04520 [Marinilabiliales bacterium]|nr:MAG: hypothetical protein C0592_04520 [Marinilabiliales bacterium]